MLGAKASVREGAGSFDDFALAGADGAAAHKLLSGTVRQGTALLGTLAEQAVKRLLEKGSPHQKHLFSDVELKRLADQIAATTATGELLGRARVRKRQEQARKHREQALVGDNILRRFASDDNPGDFRVRPGSVGSIGLSDFDRNRATGGMGFTEQPTDFTAFGDAIDPMSPAQALAHFQSLVPSLKGDANHFALQQQKKAFTLAEATDQVLLGRVKSIISAALQTGDTRQTVPAIVDVLDAAGVTPSNPGYSEMLFRTNAMSAYNTGSMREMQDPEVRDEFPVWQYLGIDDGRQGEDHEPNFNNYYSNDTDFDEVRGDRVFNCRCSFRPVGLDEWAELQADGAEVAEFHESFCGGQGGKPGPCAIGGKSKKGKTATTALPKGAFKDSGSLGDVLAKAVSAGASDTDVAARAAAARAVAASLPQGAIDRLKDSLRETVSYPDPKASTKAFEQRSGQKLDVSETIWGGYQIKSGTLHLDGGEASGDDTLRGVYAHELGHAVDASEKGGMYEYSRHEQFNAACKAEIDGGQLSEYATTDRQEAFAEFFRLNHGSDVPKAEIEKNFPLTLAFFRKKGLA